MRPASRCGLGLAAAGLAIALLSTGAPAQDQGAAVRTADAASPDDAEAGAEIGVVKAVEGEAMLARPGESRPLGVGQPLRAGDRISTGPEGAVGFTLNDGSRFSIGPNSTIVVSDFQFDPEQGLLALLARLIHGTMAHTTGAIGRIEPEAVRIGTPLGAIGARDSRVAVQQPGGETPRP